MNLALQESASIQPKTRPPKYFTFSRRKRLFLYFDTPRFQNQKVVSQILAQRPASAAVRITSRSVSETWRACPRGRSSTLKSCWLQTFRSLHWSVLSRLPLWKTFLCSSRFVQKQKLERLSLTAQTDMRVRAFRRITSRHCQWYKTCNPWFLSKIRWTLKRWSAVRNRLHGWQHAKHMVLHKINDVQKFTTMSIMKKQSMKNWELMKWYLFSSRSMLTRGHSLWRRHASLVLGELSEAEEKWYKKFKSTSAD